MDKFYKKKNYEELSAEDYQNQKRAEIQRRSKVLIQKFKSQCPDEWTLSKVLAWMDYYYICFHGDYPCGRMNYIRILQSDFWEDNFEEKDSICYIGKNGDVHIQIIEGEHLKDCVCIEEYDR